MFSVKNYSCECELPVKVSSFDMVKKAGVAVGALDENKTKNEKDLEELKNATDRAVAMTYFWVAVDMASGAASAYHGYKRNESVGWAAWWGLMGLSFPIITPAIAFAQGFGKRKL